MNVVKIGIAAALLTLGCARDEMRSPTDPTPANVLIASDGKVVTEERGGVQSATGHVDQMASPFGIVVIDQYSFSAIRTPQGQVQGQFEFRAKYENVVVRAHGEVVCLSVNGNHARIGGRVTQSTFEAGIPVGSDLTWTVTDNGEPGRQRDTASQLLGAPAEAFCATAVAQYPEAPLRRGNVQVRP